MSGRPNGPGAMNTVPPRVFKTEAAAREYMQKKGMTEAQSEAKPVAPKAGDILFNKYGEDYRLESERIGEVTLTKNRYKSGVASSADDTSISFVMPRHAVSISPASFAAFFSAANSSSESDSMPDETSSTSKPAFLAFSIYRK